MNHQIKFIKKTNSFTSSWGYLFQYFKGVNIYFLWSYC